MSKVVAVLSVVAALSGGCSVAFQKHPTAGKVATSECSSTNAYWIADSVGVVAGLGMFVGGTVATSGEHDSDAVRGAAYAGALASLLYLASAHNGYKWAHACRDVHETAPIATR